MTCIASCIPCYARRARAGSPGHGAGKRSDRGAIPGAVRPGRVLEELPWGTSLVQRPHESKILDRPSSDTVARELAPLLRNGGDAVREAWEESVAEHGPDPTATQVRETVKRRQSGMPDSEPSWVARIGNARGRDSASGTPAARAASGPCSERWRSAA